jgi:DNA-binding transcriptional ArsR family regulator
MADTAITPLKEAHALHAARLLQALAHPKRLLMLALLSERKLPASAVGLSRATVFKHLNRMVEVGVLSVNVEAAGMTFSVSPEADPALGSRQLFPRNVRLQMTSDDLLDRPRAIIFCTTFFADKGDNFPPMPPPRPCCLQARHANRKAGRRRSLRD